MRPTIKKAAPEAEGTISLPSPPLKLIGNLVHFEAFKNHIGFMRRRKEFEAFNKELPPAKVEKERSKNNKR